jgi:hypothetical protein
MEHAVHDGPFHTYETLKGEPQGGERAHHIASCDAVSTHSLSITRTKHSRVSPRGVSGHRASLRVMSCPLTLYLSRSHDTAATLHGLARYSSTPIRVRFSHPPTRCDAQPVCLPCSRACAGTGTVAKSRSENFADFHYGMSMFLRHGKLPSVVHSLVGEPVVLYKEKINYKRAGGGGYTPHQDVYGLFHRDAPPYSFMTQVRRLTLPYTPCLQQLADSL